MSLTKLLRSAASVARRYESTYQRARAADPALARYESAVVLLDALSPKSALTTPERDVLVRTLLGCQRTASHPLWQTLLAHAFTAMLRAFRKRMRRREDAGNRVLLAFFEAIASVPPSARPNLHRRPPCDDPSALRPPARHGGDGAARRANARVLAAASHRPAAVRRVPCGRAGRSPRRAVGGSGYRARDRRCRDGLRAGDSPGRTRLHRQTEAHACALARETSTARACSSPRRGDVSMSVPKGTDVPMPRNHGLLFRFLRQRPPFEALDSTQWQVFIAVACHWQTKGKAWPSQETLGKFCGLDPRTVRRSVDVLVAENALVLREAKVPTGKIGLLYSPGRATCDAFDAYERRFPSESRDSPDTRSGPPEGPDTGSGRRPERPDTGSGQPGPPDTGSGHDRTEDPTKLATSEI